MDHKILLYRLSHRLPIKTTQSIPRYVGGHFCFYSSLNWDFLLFSSIYIPIHSNLKKNVESKYTMYSQRNRNSKGESWDSKGINPQRPPATVPHVGSTHPAKAKSSRGNHQKQVPQSTNERVGSLAVSNLYSSSCLTFLLHSPVACLFFFSVHSSPQHLINIP